MKAFSALPGKLDAKTRALENLQEPTARIERHGNELYAKAIEARKGAIKQWKEVKNFVEDQQKEAGEELAKLQGFLKNHRPDTYHDNGVHRKELNQDLFEAVTEELDHYRDAIEFAEGYISEHDKKGKTKYGPRRAFTQEHRQGLEASTQGAEELHRENVAAIDADSKNFSAPQAPQHGDVGSGHSVNTTDGDGERALLLPRKGGDKRGFFGGSRRAASGGSKKPESDSDTDTNNAGCCSRLFCCFVGGK